MTEVDPEGFSAATKELAEGEGSPYARISRARNHLESAELEGLAFGLACTPIVMGQYNDAQSHLFEQLDTGSENMHAVIGGLNTILRNYGAAEAANVVQPSNVETEAPEQGEVWQRWVLAGETMGMAVAGLPAMKAFGSLLGMGATAAATKAVCVATTKLAIAAGISVAAWATFIPNDPALDQAHAHLEEASDELTTFDDEMVNITDQFARAWEGDAHDTFSSYLQSLMNEVERCQQAVSGFADALKNIHSSITSQQIHWFAATIGNLVAIIALEVSGNAFPPAKPAAETAKQALGAAFSVLTGSWVAWAVSQVKSTIGMVNNLASIDAKDDSDEKVDLESVALDQSDIDTMVEQSTS